MEIKIIKLPAGSEICGFCGEKINSEWNYCPKCKGKLEKIKCYSCQNTVDLNWKYCPYCKAQLDINNEAKRDFLKNGNDWLRDVLGD